MLRRAGAVFCVSICKSCAAFIECKTLSDAAGARARARRTRARHREHLKRCTGALMAFEELASLGESAPLDLAAEEVRIAAEELGRITGRIDVEELLDVIFRDFCIGK